MTHEERIYKIKHEKKNYTNYADKNMIFVVLLGLGFTLEDSQYLKFGTTAAKTFLGMQAGVAEV